MLSLDWNKTLLIYATAIASSTKLFQGEALLKTLQDRIAMIHKIDAELELLIQD